MIRHLWKTETEQTRARARRALKKSRATIISMNRFHRTGRKKRKKLNFYFPLQYSILTICGIIDGNGEEK